MKLRAGAGVCTIAALLTLPVAGTALYIMDQYVNPQESWRHSPGFLPSHPCSAIIISGTGLWICFALAIHPLMGAFFFFCAQC